MLSGAQDTLGWFVVVLAGGESRLWKACADRTSMHSDRVDLGAACPLHGSQRLLFLRSCLLLDQSLFRSPSPMECGCGIHRRGNFAPVKEFFKAGTAAISVKHRGTRLEADTGEQQTRAIPCRGEPRPCPPCALHLPSLHREPLCFVKPAPSPRLHSF